ncbi:hypothetical protein Q7P37_000195 [Cladosporium fusiforme]
MLLNNTPSAEFYNSLPLINDGTMPLAATDLDLLGSVTRKHGVQDLYQVHLVHRHFDMPAGHVLASTLSKDGLEVHLPAPIATGQALLGTHFFVTGEGNYQPFEFKASAAKQTSDLQFEHADFLQDFAHAVLAAGLQNQVALTIADGTDNQREIAGEGWTVHYRCDNTTQKCLDAKSIAVGWRFEGASGPAVQCTNWYVDPSNENGHRQGHGGDNVEPFIDADAVVSDLRARDLMCCA